METSIRIKSGISGHFDYDNNDLFIKSVSYEVNRGDYLKIDGHTYRVVEIVRDESRKIPLNIAYIEEIVESHGHYVRELFKIIEECHVEKDMDKERKINLENFYEEVGKYFRL